ncbi:matrin 3-like 1.2 [Myripristis murdjan]|uniref:Matrin-3-like n=1 Tax=Myripristis murdjan TaxID=586833 RepID=A0A668AF95_9TELE|nr:matrin-3-like [Myripristis murdjan]XP_029917120.1 matrin-3-like [Myripristis murdjan]XP_029917121.1 matrin-3-like [Myripristis murdjan]
MSQKNQSDGSQKGFAVGRGLLAAAETLNFSMNEQRSGPASRPMGGMVSGMGVGGGGGVEGQEHSSQMSRRGGGGGGGGGGGTSNLGSTMKLFASLGLSPADLDALAQIPEENISVETLPHILMQLKSRKGDAGERRMAANSRDLPPMSSETSYRGGREDWDDMHIGRMGGPSMGQTSARASHPPDFGYGSMQDVPSSRGYNLDYGNNNGGAGSRERQYSELSHHDSYGGLGMGPSPSDPVFMQRRMGSPSHGKVQDFLGVMPPMFPHVCSLCDFDVHSTMEWNQHTNGLRHAENRRLLLEMYPDWDPGMSSSRGGPHLMDTPNLSSGLLGPAPMGPGQQSGGMPSSWGGGGGPGLSGKNQSHSGPKMRSRVVVAKYDRKPLSNKSLFAFAEPFGCLREHLVLKNKAFLEMDTHQEASDMVNYYQQHPATMYGKPITFYLSKELMVIEKDDRKTPRLGDRPGREVKGRGSQVVFFSNLPREEEKKMELLTIAGRFGTVEKHLFLTDEAFVQLGNPEDAEMLVKYYTVNPLTIKGRPIRLNICTKYKTLNVNRRMGQGSFGGNSRGRRSSGTAASSSSSGTKSSSKSSSSKSSSSSKAKEEKKKEEEEDKATAEDKHGSEEEVAGVMEGEDRGDDEDEEEEEEEEMEEEEQGEENQATDRDVEAKDEDQTAAEETETTGSATEPPESHDAPREKDSDVDDATKEADRDAGKEEQGAEPEGPAQSEASHEDAEAKDEASVEPGESSELNEGDFPGDPEDQDFLENMDDFVTLDELAEDEDEGSDTIDKTRKGGMRVVNIVGFRRGYGFLNELLALAKPFGKVVKHLVLDLRPEAYLQFATEDEAKAMARFYNSNVTASVCGRSVRVSHSMTYPTIQCGSSRVVYIGQIPNIKYSDETILELAEPFGKVRKYFLNRIKRECFIEMENAEDAERMAEDYKANPPKIQGKRLTVYVSRKYKQLKYGHRRPSIPEDKKPLKRDGSGAAAKSSKHSEEPPAKKMKEEKEPAAEEKKEEEEKTEERKEEAEKAEAPGGEQRSDEDSAKKETIPEGSEPAGSTEAEVKQEEETETETETSAAHSRQTEEAAAAVVAVPDTKPSVATLPLAAYDPDTPIGVEHVKMGYYCRVCFLFYSNEETAKKVHCSSQAHYDRLKKYLEREQTKTQGTKKGKKPSA